MPTTDGSEMWEAAMGKQRPIHLSVDQALQIVWKFEDVAGRKLNAEEDAVLMPLAEQVQRVHARIQGEFYPETPARDIPIRGKTVDKSP